MSEQTNPTANAGEEETETTPVAENTTVEDNATEAASTTEETATTEKAAETTPAAPPQQKAAPAAPTRTPARAVAQDDDDDDDDEQDDEESYHIPSQYAPSGSGRPRRIGSDVKVNDIDYKKVAVLSRFLDSRGRILSRRKTRVSAKVQRRIVVAIKRARHLALLPYTADQTRIVRKRR